MDEHKRQTTFLFKAEKLWIVAWTGPEGFFASFWSGHLKNANDESSNPSLHRHYGNDDCLVKRGLPFKFIILFQNSGTKLWRCPRLNSAVTLSVSLQLSLSSSSLFLLEAVQVEYVHLTGQYWMCVHLVLFCRSFLSSKRCFSHSSSIRWSVFRHSRCPLHWARNLLPCLFPSDSPSPSPSVRSSFTSLAMTFTYGTRTADRLA